MNAQYAREKVKEVNSKKGNTQSFSIQVAIRRAVEEGKYQTFWYEYILPEVRKELEQMGYKVGENESVRNEVCISISWKSQNP